MEAEQEYNKLFEDKCIKTGLNLIDIFYPSSDEQYKQFKMQKRLLKRSMMIFAHITYKEIVISMFVAVVITNNHYGKSQITSMLKNERGIPQIIVPTCGFKLN